MYKDQILDLYKNPMNEGSMEDPDLEALGDNPSCGDSTEVHVETKNRVIKDVKHETDGCAISTASLSIASEEVQGMKVDEVLELDKDWMLEELGIDVSPMRLKCALLGLKTIQKAIK